VRWWTVSRQQWTQRPILTSSSWQGPTALAVEGLQSAIDRASACVEAGADMIFPGPSQNWACIRNFVRAVKVPVLATISPEFGSTPLYTVQELRQRMSPSFLYPLSAFVPCPGSAFPFMTHPKQGTQKDVVGLMQTRDELYDHLGLPTRLNKKLNTIFSKEEQE